MMNKNDRNKKRQQRFIKVLSRKMAKAGFECQMSDNHFVVSKEGKPFEIRIGKALNWGRRRVHFSLDFALQDMDKVQQQGLMWLTSECNNHSDYTTTHLWNDHFSCCVVSSIRSAKEFLHEFDFAYEQIGITFNNLVANYPNIKEQFQLQPERRRIGFLADRYQDEDNLEMCKLVARTNITFANENKTERL